MGPTLPKYIVTMMIALPQSFKLAVKFRDSLQSCLKQPTYQMENCTVLGPAPSPVPKINYNFRYRLTLKCHLNTAVRQLLGHLLRQFSQDKANRGVNAFIDVNGYE